MLQGVVRALGEALVRLYYPVRIVDDGQRIPTGKPVIFVLNHPNGLMDPLVLRVATGRRSRFLAKSSLFGNPLGRLAMNAFGSIPIHRPGESSPAAVARNEESFARCRAELAAGGVLALFPEGTSHSDPQLRPLKTGAARIALSAEAEADGRLGVTIVPVGLAYERKTQFRSSVLLVVGEPLAVAPLLPEYRRDERATVAALTAEIAARLDAIVLQAESRDLLAGIARVARWTSAAPDDAAARHRAAREMAAAYERLRARDPARVDAIVAEVRTYGQTLRRLGVRDPWALEIGAPRAGAILGAVGILALAAPLALLGALMGWVPYRLSGVVARRVTRDEDLLSTVKLLAGALFLVVGWSAEAAVAGWWRGAAWAAPVFGLGVASGYVALRFEELLRDGRAAWRALSMRAFHFQTARRLADRRRALADAVTRALRDEASGPAE
ncbi:MAG TPA: lysophospholipid acyltransferase family protein [Polyangia bacterium]|nr:lysophospholipid acyltransferase family protein [Polyangia bacterium]